MKNKLFLSALFFGFLLTSCGGTGSETLVKTSVEIEISNSKNVSNKIINPNDVTLSDNLYSINDRLYYNTNYLPSRNDMVENGVVNLLVVPVLIPEYYEPYLNPNTGAADKDITKDKIVKDLNTVFFGDASETGWESVKSFYKKSSNGKLELTGEVTDWYDAELSGFDYASSIGISQTQTIVNDAITYLKDNKGMDLSKYDNDKDGFIDGIWYVYAAPDYTHNGPNTDDQNFWAYTYWANQDSNGNPDDPIANLFGWASYDFMYEGYGKRKLDAHTYIHETGHFLGLNDYYSDSLSYNPIGKVDMMDSNIIDQNMYSKMLLGWTKPYLVTGNATIDLKSMQNENALIVIPGDSYVINDKNEFDPFSEYILIELYTNEGLNYDDSRRSVSDRPLAMNDKGVRIYHIDNRKFVVDVKSKKDDGTYTSKEYKTGDTIDSQHKIILPMSNDRGSSRYNYGFGVDSNDNLFDEVRVIEANNVDSFSNGGYQTSKTLFKEGSSFDIGTYSKFFINKSSDKTKGLLDTGDSFSKTISIGEIK